MIPAVAALIVGLVYRYYMLEHKSSWFQEFSTFCSSGGHGMLDQNLLVLNAHIYVSLLYRERGGILTAPALQKTQNGQLKEGF
jgi:hypothetical protein